MRAALAALFLLVASLKGEDASPLLIPGTESPDRAYAIGFDSTSSDWDRFKRPCISVYSTKAGRSVSPSIPQTFVGRATGTASNPSVPHTESNLEYDIIFDVTISRDAKASITRSKD
jgi:hypothetical protein